MPQHYGKRSLSDILTRRGAAVGQTVSPDVFAEAPKGKGRGRTRARLKQLRGRRGRKLTEAQRQRIRQFMGPYVQEQTGVAPEFEGPTGMLMRLGPQQTIDLENPRAVADYLGEMERMQRLSQQLPVGQGDALIHFAGRR
jgi:hypothetical protein